MAFYAGALNRVSWMATGTSSYTELCNFRHDWTESDEGHDVTSACHSGVQAIIATILRGEGTASFHIRSADLPWSISIKAQVTGLLKSEHANRQPFIIPVMITRVAYTNETAAGNDYVVSFKLNAEAGTYQYPS